MPAHKVEEIFKAVIQLPLLRCPTDKRRQGKLATARMKEYSRAKKQWQVDNGINTKPPPPPPPGKERDHPIVPAFGDLVGIAGRLGPEAGMGGMPGTGGEAGARATLGQE